MIAYRLHLPWAAEVTRPSLQSLVQDLFHTSCSFPFATHGYVLHIQNDSHGIPLDTYQPDDFFTIHADRPNSFSYIACSCCIACFSMYAFWLVGILFRNNIFDSLCVDYTCKFVRNGDRGRLISFRNLSEYERLSFLSGK